jgi:sulfur carrier protein ThiS
MKQRRTEPPTESYAETRVHQLFRELGYVTWRQVQIISSERIVQRADFVLSFGARVRPALFRPDDGLVVEVDGRFVHERQFEQDHRRQSNYDRLGYHWVSFSANQIEH